MLLACGCAGAGFYGREGRIHYGAQFGQSDSSMQNRKNIAINFGIISVGMSKKEVLDKLGEPASTTVTKDNHYVWYYNSVPALDKYSEPIKDVYIFFDDYKVINPPSSNVK